MRKPSDLLLALVGRSFASAVVALPALGGALAAQVVTHVVPSNVATVESSSGNRYPFGDSIPRYQQAFAEWDLAPLLGSSIREIAFRADTGTSTPPVGFQYGNVRLRLSTGDNLVDNLSSDLDQNLGSDALVVYDGAYVIGAITSGPGPNPFDFRFVLSTPFHYLGGDLLVDVEIASPVPSSWYLDAPDTTSDSGSRAWKKSTSSLASKDSQVLVMELVALAGTPEITAMVDCGGNAGSLDYVSGFPFLGSAVGVAMSDAQAVGVVGYLAFAVKPAAGWPPCGIALGAMGELMLDPLPPTPVALIGGGTAWTGAPMNLVFPIPNDVNLVGAKLFAQGLWADLWGVAPFEPLRLTNGLEIEIGF